jgi:para-nitrobenzyl esterase
VETIWGAGIQLADAEKNGVKFAESLGAHSIADLRRKSPEELLKAGRVPMGLIVDGWVLPQDVYSTFADGKQNDVPLIAGTVGSDAPGPAPAALKAADAVANAKKTYGDLADDYLKVYPADTDQDATKSAAAFRTNRAEASARTFVRLQTKTGKSKAYWYIFTHTSPFPEGLVWGGRPAKDWGAYHGSEIVYVFDEFPLQDWAWRSMDLKVGDIISSMWVNFAKTGDPNGVGLPKWPAYDPKADVLLNFSDNPQAQPAPFKQALSFLDKWDAEQRSK